MEKEKTSLFEDIKFGDKFLTRGGKVAIFLHKVGINGYLDKHKDHYRFGTDLETFAVDKNGYYNSGSTIHDCLDIISKYEDPIDEEKLLSMANESLNNILKFASAQHVAEQMRNNYIGGFKAGYRKAKKE